MSPRAFLFALALASCAGAQHPGAPVAAGLEGEVLRAARGVQATEDACTNTAGAMLKSAEAIEGEAKVARLESAKRLQHECNETTAKALAALGAAEESIDLLGGADVTRLQCALAEAAAAMRKVQSLIPRESMPKIVARALDGAERGGAGCPELQGPP